MTRSTLVGGAVVAALLAAAGAPRAATYNFVVDYLGGGSTTSTSAALAPGSDDMLGTTLKVGDSFTYTLNAQAGHQWNTTVTADLFLFLDIAVLPSVTPVTFRTGDATVDLFGGGADVFHFNQPGARGCCATLGTQHVLVPEGLHFDQWVLHEVYTQGVDSTPSSLLPWDGLGPEHGLFAGFITYTSLAGPAGGAVPEPGAWALMILGFGGVGGVLRRRRERGLASA